jgi:putative transposase
VWITEYRYKILRGRIAYGRPAEQICEAREAVIILGAVAPDQIHMLLSAPPDMALAKLVPYLKGRSSRRLQDEFPELGKHYLGAALVGGGYFCASVGAVDEETIKKYI